MGRCQRLCRETPAAGWSLHCGTNTSSGTLSSARSGGRGRSWNPSGTEPGERCVLKEAGLSSVR